MLFSLNISLLKDVGPVALLLPGFVDAEAESDILKGKFILYTEEKINWIFMMNRKAIVSELYNFATTLTVMASSR